MITTEFKGTIFKDHTTPDCPICGQVVEYTEDYNTPTSCEHIIGVYAPWYDEDEIEDMYSSQATHLVISQHVSSGMKYWYFKDTSIQVGDNVEFTRVLWKEVGVVVHTFNLGDSPIYVVERVSDITGRKEYYALQDNQVKKV